MSCTISPSLLACDFLNIQDELAAFKTSKNLWFHLDIMDGHFVPNLTFGHPIIKLISQKTNIPLDAHLMVSNPKFYIESFSGLNIHNLTWHIEASENNNELIETAKGKYKSVGISIKPGTDVSALNDKILSQIDLLLIMSVEPGFGGQKFIETTYARIKYFSDLKKSKGHKYIIQVDGGVNDINSAALISAGAENLVAGSFIFKADANKYLNNVESLRTIK